MGVPDFLSTAFAPAYPKLIPKCVTAFQAVKTLGLIYFFSWAGAGAAPQLDAAGTAAEVNHAMCYDVQSQQNFDSKER